LSHERPAWIASVPVTQARFTPQAISPASLRQVKAGQT
jgi:hypothetical protein